MEAQLVSFFQQFHPLVQGGIATLFTWFMTALGAVPVFFTKNVNHKIMAGMLGLAAGVMIAASYWSLLNPAIEMSGGSWVPAAIGFVGGALFFQVLDKLLPHMHPALSEKVDNENEPEGVKTSLRRSVLLVLAVTIHNIPEGMAIGVAFGAASLATNPAMATEMIMGGVALAIGIGIQNMPEGLAVAMPLRREGLSRAKAFWYGQLSGIVELFAGVLGAWLVIQMKTILPYSLAFAAGAMIFVVIEELIPEAQQTGENDIATMGTILGFTIMMVLDVALG